MILTLSRLSNSTGDPPFSLVASLLTPIYIPPTLWKWWN